MTNNSYPGEENVFFPIQFCIPKANIVPPIFLKKPWPCSEWETLNASVTRWCLTLTGAMLLMSENRRTGSDHFPCQIDVGLHFPYSITLVELCQHFQIMSTQLYPNTFCSWADFKILCYKRGWTYTLSLSLSPFYPLQCNPFKDWH